MCIHKDLLWIAGLEAGIFVWVWELFWSAWNPLSITWLHYGADELVLLIDFLLFKLLMPSVLAVDVFGVDPSRGLWQLLLEASFPKSFILIRFLQNHLCIYWFLRTFHPLKATRCYRALEFHVLSGIMENSEHNTVYKILLSSESFGYGR